MHADGMRTVVRGSVSELLRISGNVRWMLSCVAAPMRACVSGRMYVYRYAQSSAPVRLTAVARIRVVMYVVVHVCVYACLRLCSHARNRI